MSHEISGERGGADQSWIMTPSVTPEGAFSGNDMQHFTDCSFVVLQDSPYQRQAMLSAAVGEVGVYDSTKSGPIVTYLKHEDGTIDIACWGTQACPGATITVPLNDIVTLTMPQAARASHNVCSGDTRLYVNDGKVTRVTITPFRK